MPRLSLSLLGSFQAALDGQPITGFESDRVRGLLAYLAVEAGRPHRRDKLVGLLWPDWPETSALTNLRNALANLRKAIGDREAATPVLLADRETIQFDPSGDGWVDVQAFLAHTHPQQPAERLAEGLALYRGPFLDGFSLKDSAAFEEWITATREQLERRCLAGLARLTEQHAEAGDLAKACEVAWCAVDLAPWQEESHCRLMRLLAVSGQRSAALTQYETCRSVLKRELGVEPAAGTIRLYEQIRDGVIESGRVGEWESRSVAASASDSPPLSPSPTPPLSHLPTWLTPFVGRRGLVADVRQQLLVPDCRLLALVGPGGSGKTRLAVAAAEGVTDAFPNGVHFVALATVQSPEGIVPTIGQTLGFTFREREDPREQLLQYLRAKTLLLILDNCEHLLSQVEAPCADSAGITGIICDIAQAAPGVKLLVTSRARLNVEGEQLLPIRGMTLPEEVVADPAEALASSAVQLFAQAALRVQPTFRLSDDNLAQVIAICRRVAGLPLGIVLAAAWLRLLTPAEVVAELEGHGLDFLESDRHDLPDRQRSLRAACDYSWRLLNQREREVLAGLAVFRGGATYTAAQQVTSATLRDLRRLANASLVDRTPAGRYVLHELLRQYAEEKLAGTPDGGRGMRDRHAAYFMATLRRWTAELKGPRQRDALAEMDVEITNVEAAWSWAIEQGPMERLAEGLEGLALFYTWRMRLQDGESTFRALTDALEAPDVAPSVERLKLRIVAWAQRARFSQALGQAHVAAEQLQRSLALLDEPALVSIDVRRERAHTLLILGEHHHGSGDCSKAREPLAESVSIYRSFNDQHGAATSLLWLGTVAERLGDFTEAVALHEEALTLFRRLGASRQIVDGLLSLSLDYSHLGQDAETERLQRESIAISQTLGDRFAVAFGRYRLALVLTTFGQYVDGLEMLQESAAIFADLGSRSRLALALVRMSGVNGCLGRYEQARTAGVDGLTLARDIGHPWITGLALSTLSWLAALRGDYQQAHELAQDSLTVFKQCGAPYDVGYALVNQVEAAIGLGRLDEARQTLIEAMRLALRFRQVATSSEALVEAVLFAAAVGDGERAVELAALNAQFPWTANQRPWQDIYSERIAAVAVHLAPDVLAAAEARGREKDMWAAFEELLAVWGG
jgi:predicted ATPase/DNA-binding SARP family transcriptional activator